ncbi:PREDICTED: zinc finger protein 184-like isoform X2 [Nicrophorus vespilloides]|nr:PREDICTED: zinc finger protein 184-like isoform X2 [Nicrophorus vespilloides]
MKTYSRKKPGDQDEVIIDLNELCRLCMAKEDALVPIFNDQDPIPLSLRIMACVALEVFEGDGLPNKICHPCKYQLEKSYTFRKKCENSDLKLRHHLKDIQEKLGNDIVILPDMKHEILTIDNEIDTVDFDGDLNTEEDLVGVTQVTYIQPDPEPEDPESITLPVDGTKEDCTLTALQKETTIEDVENIYMITEEQKMEHIEDQQQQEDGIIDDQDLDVIAEAVKSTLATHPNLNLTGELQMKVDQQPGKPTQVQVTTEDGSVIIMELLTDESEQVQAMNMNAQELNEEGELKVFKCPDCPKSFSRRIQLRRHASVHMQQRGFSCGICEKWFPTRSALIRHERIHTGERPFQCEICEKSFAQKEILYRHLNTHTGLKPYTCPHCSKGFSQKEPLRVHMKTHLNSCDNDVQLHYCTLCPKVFCHASGLSRHLLTHTGKMFKCRDCDKNFTDKSSLRRHHRQTNHQE